MDCERLETIKESDKSSVYLVFDKAGCRMAVEKHLAGELPVYRVLEGLRHPCLPAIYELRIAQGETVVWEEYIPGSSAALAAASERQLRRWLLELCGALSLLHRKGIVHRDIKPSNLLPGADGHIRLIDFDAAREHRSEAESDTRLLGTRGYASPEQYGFAQTDGRTDIYSLGVTFRELLGPKAKRLRWRNILRRCTSIDPKRRYQGIWQLSLALRLETLHRRVLLPLLTALLTLTAAFTIWSYGTDTDFRDAITVVLQSRRASVFETADISALRLAERKLSQEAFTGDDLAAYDALKAWEPELEFISTGYADEAGDALFGGFSIVFLYRTGERYYSSFTGLYTIRHHIPPEDCQPYAPAVMKLYSLSIFDTPLF